MPALQTTTVKFDANNKEHLEAFMHLEETGRLHPKIRFEVEPPYLSAPDMIRAKLAMRYCRTLLKKGKTYDHDISDGNSSVPRSTARGTHLACVV